jgi:F1F0 ATPase subunit 2
MDMMNNITDLIFALVAGVLVGSFFFLGLWYSTQKIGSTNHPFLWTIGSFVVRVGVTLLVFYFVGAGDYKNMLACLLGFIAAKIIILQITKSLDKKSSLTLKETLHGTQS